MLRHKLSAGLLRSTPVPQVSTPVCRPRSRSLASAVLLSSQRNWKSETVVTLKTELKKRGLSQQGNKATLISRLESAETSSLLGPLPPFSSTSPSASVNGSRSLSTSSKASQTPKKAEAGPGSELKGEPSVTSTGPIISSQTTEAPKVETIEPEKITVAPGLPNSDVASTASASEKLDLRFPGSQADEEVQQVIPLTPDNFSSKVVTTDSAPSLSPPKVLTVASASTHLSGGPVHGTHESADAHSIETKDESGPSLKDIPSLGAAITSILTSPARAWVSSGVRMPEINLPKSDKNGEYKSEKRALNDEERKGLYVFAGILGLGLALGGGKKDKKGSGLKDKVNQLKDKAESSIPGSRTVKGDEKWEKASGAGVVGHGSRKD